jgi:hypothetical protein
MRTLLPAALAVFCSIAAVQGQLTPSPAPPQVQPAPPPQPPEVAQGHAAFQKEDWAGAAAAYQAALAMGADHPFIHFRLGYALHALKRYDEALTHHLRGGRINHPNIRIDCLYNAACALSLLGRKDEALRYFTYAIDAGFVDTAQVGKDTDLDPLREDDRFKALVASIGKGRRLDQQADFLIGEWIAAGPGGERRITFSRPEGSRALQTTARGPGAVWAGALVPDAAERTWRWSSADGIGTTLTLTGNATDDGLAFQGRDATAVGEGVHIRMTLTPRDGSLHEVVEVSDDGKSWRPHHHAHFQRPSKGG